MKKYRQKDWLYNEYITNKKSALKISEETGYTRAVLEKWLVIHKIPKRSLRDAQLINSKYSEKFRNKEWLSSKYHKEHLSMTQIGKIVGCSHSVIQKWMKDFGIKTRPARPYSGKYNWRYQGFCENKNGYKQIYLKNGRRGKYRAEHLLNIEKEIGRKLRKGECVHHIDGNKRNNCTDNLKLFINESEHQRYEYFISLFAKQLIWGEIKTSNRKEIKKLFDKFVKEHSNNIS